MEGYWVNDKEGFEQSLKRWVISRWWGNSHWIVDIALSQLHQRILQFKRFGSTYGRFRQPEIFVHNTMNHQAIISNFAPRIVILQQKYPRKRDPAVPYVFANSNQHNSPELHTGIEIWKHCNESNLSSIVKSYAVIFLLIWRIRKEEWIVSTWEGAPRKDNLWVTLSKTKFTRKRLQSLAPFMLNWSNLSLYFVICNWIMEST